MKLLLETTSSISFNCKADLAKAIPLGKSGQPLNYGQGEGQVEIDGTVWGFYVDGEQSYQMAFEEGVVEWAKIQELVSEIVKALSHNFSTSISIHAVGPFTGATDV
jgi:hypothetical protein